MTGELTVEATGETVGEAKWAALRELEQHDAEAAKLVKLRYFAGLTHQQAAEALGIGRRAADRLWALARAWLYRQMTDK